MFGFFKSRSSKSKPTPVKTVSEKTPHWVKTGDYTFNRVKPESEPDTFNKVTHGRVAEMLDEDDMAWTIPKQQKSTGCVSLQCFDS
ncbi:hypothetical protein M378DRAFT_164579 [Amanita muscaria Koide BX008]|uniref:Uncharacterized protein n=1 Tax=Amanita muscaria (strain Koide BX008) TaxID=946122 RepID=A0A0C2X3J1_AMAMK|nr:hypothetical protein M378DRAFT_164579 [Amanita muscaria Koide BX008]